MTTENNKKESEGEIKRSFSYYEVIEILRHALFGGTPDLYDNGGLHGNHNLVKDHTSKRATEALEHILSYIELTPIASKEKEYREALEKIEVEFCFMFPYGQQKGGGAYNLSSPIIIPQEKLPLIKKAIEDILNK